MIGGRVGNVVKRFACNGDDVLLAKLERVRGFDVERKLLRRPAKYYLPNLTPLWSDGNLGADRSDIVSGRILQLQMNIAVCFDFCGNDSPCKRVPFCSDGILFRCRAGQFHIRPEPFPCVNLRWCF